MRAKGKKPTAMSKLITRAEFKANLEHYLNAVLVTVDEALGRINSRQTRIEDALIKAGIMDAPRVERALEIVHGSVAPTKAEIGRFNASVPTDSEGPEAA